MASVSEGRRRRAGFALGSLLLHALVLSLAASRAVDGASPASRGTGHEATPAAQELAIELEPERTLAEVLALAPVAEPAPSPRVSRASRAQVEGPWLEERGGALEPGDEAPSEAGSRGGSAAAPPPASSAAAPRLGLAELGVAGPNQFLAPPDNASPRRARTQDVKERLDHALAQGLQARDTSLGLGAGSPVMRALEGAVYASTAPLNGSAVFSFVIDSDGKVLRGSVGAVSAEREQWERVARQVVQSLGERKLRVPKGKSVKLTIAVTSHLEMPSGRDPGVELRALGIPLKKGEGRRSTRLELLNPLNPGVPLLLDGDPADLGATARRMVRSHVVSEELL